MSLWAHRRVVSSSQSPSESAAVPTTADELPGHDLSHHSALETMVPLVCGEELLSPRLAGAWVKWRTIHSTLVVPPGVTRVGARQRHDPGRLGHRAGRSTSVKPPPARGGAALLEQQAVPEISVSRTQRPDARGAGRICRFPDIAEVIRPFAPIRPVPSQRSPEYSAAADKMPRMAEGEGVTMLMRDGLPSLRMPRTAWGLVSVPGCGARI